MVIDIFNVAEYYGDIDLNILKDVLDVFPDTTKFGMLGARYSTSDEDLNKLIEDYHAYINNH